MNIVGNNYGNNMEMTRKFEEYHTETTEMHAEILIDFNQTGLINQRFIFRNIFQTEKYILCRRNIIEQPVCDLKLCHFHGFEIKRRGYILRTKTIMSTNFIQALSKELGCFHQLGFSLFLKIFKNGSASAVRKSFFENQAFPVSFFVAFLLWWSAKYTPAHLNILFSNRNTCSLLFNF